MTTRSCLVVLAAVLVIGGCSRPQRADNVWASLPLGTDAEFEDVWFADSLNGWIVGGSYRVEGGLVGRTHDGGQTWSFTSGLATQEPGAFRFNLNVVQFLNARRGLVASDGGKIFATDDGGETWRLVRYGHGLVDHVFDLDFLDDRNGWAVGLGGVLRTFDGGETWQPVNSRWPHSESESGYAIHFIDERRGWLGGQYGIQWSEDGGRTWAAVRTPLAPEERPKLVSMCFVDRTHGWAVGEEGTILRTADGVTWVRQDTGIPNAKSAPRLESIRRGSRVEHWDLGERSPGLVLTSVHFIDEHRGWVVGNFGTDGRSIVLRTDDGGATWITEADVQGEELRALFVLDAEHAWTIGDRVRPGDQTVLRRAIGPAKI